MGVLVSEVDPLESDYAVSYLACHSKLQNIPIVGVEKGRFRGGKPQRAG
jgi:hypothetical protein